MTIDRNRIQAIGYLCHLAERRYLNLDTKDGVDIYLNDYQNRAKIYLDEYDVEEWNYLPLFDNSLLMKRFLRKD